MYCGSKIFLRGGKSMYKTLLMVYSWLLLIMGILGAIPGIGLGTEPIWHAVLKIILGLIGVLVTFRKEKS